jgi:hypothetical protein
MRPFVNTAVKEQLAGLMQHGSIIRQKTLLKGDISSSCPKELVS